MMKTTLKTMVAAAVVATGLGGVAQAATVAGVMFDLASSNGALNKSATYDFNDFSIADLTTDIDGDPDTPSIGDVITGNFFVESISIIEDLGNGITGETATLADSGIELTGAYTLTLTGFGVGSSLIFDAEFDLFEDTTPDASTTSDPVGSADYIDGTLFAELSSSSYTLIPIGGGQFAIAGGTALSVDGPPAPAGINDPVIGLDTSIVTGTGTVFPNTGSLSDFRDEFTFRVNATVVPVPAAMVAGLPIMAALAFARRRRLNGAKLF